jgi:hemolysin III
MSSVSHGIGALFGIAALVLCVCLSAIHGNVWAVVSSAIYGGSLIILYSMSSIYHALKINRAKSIFRIFDHCSIFLLIAGTYTPYTLVTLRESGIGWVLFGIVWGAGILGIILNSINLKKFKIFSMICYLAMGWSVVFAAPQIGANLAPAGIALLLWGGIAYTVGAVLYMFGKKVRYFHSVWHLFVLAGSILQFFSILFYVV